MKILFLENRQQTFFWQAIAAKLRQDGHQIFWIVQNAHFSPFIGHSHVIPYPNGRRLPFPDDPATYKVVSSDRNVKYFGGNTSHYGYYDSEIAHVLDTVRPDAVFGEATLFHELLCIRHCRRRNIPYLQPTSCRYPLGRFSFYMYETQIPFHGSGEILPERDCLETVAKIALRKIEPDYMKKDVSNGVIMAKLRALRNGLGITASYFSGERYNTPSPARKLFCELRLRRNKLRWEELAKRVPTGDGRFRILYPLQMQPESTIDVWGNGYHNQVQLLSSLLEATDGNAVIVVKPNPKSRYELSDDLLDLMTNSEAFCPVSHAARMEDVIETVDLIVTVTGTVAIEAIFAGHPIVTLTETLSNTVPQCVYLDDLNRLRDVVHDIQQGIYPKARDSEKVAFLNVLTQTSYKGVISNPYSTPTCLSGNNISDVHFAFQKILGVIEGGCSDFSPKGLRLAAECTQPLSHEGCRSAQIAGPLR
jgi:hypothetical protein